MKMRAFGHLFIRLNLVGSLLLPSFAMADTQQNRGSGSPLSALASTNSRDRDRALEEILSSVRRTMEVIRELRDQTITIYPAQRERAEAGLRLIGSALKERNISRARLNVIAAGLENENTFTRAATLILLAEFEEQALHLIPRIQRLYRNTHMEREMVALQAALSRISPEELENFNKMIGYLQPQFTVPYNAFNDYELSPAEVEEIRQGERGELPRNSLFTPLTHALVCQVQTELTIQDKKVYLEAHGLEEDGLNEESNYQVSRMGTYFSRVDKTNKTVALNLERFIPRSDIKESEVLFIQNGHADQPNKEIGLKVLKTKTECDSTPGCLPKNQVEFQMVYGKTSFVSAVNGKTDSDDLSLGTSLKVDTSELMPTLDSTEAKKLKLMSVRGAYVDTIECVKKKISSQRITEYNIVENLPRQVVLRTRQEGFTTENFYKIKDGRIYFKSNPAFTEYAQRRIQEAPPEENEWLEKNPNWQEIYNRGKNWQLFGGHELQGLPPQDMIEKDEYFVEFQVEAETIVALSNKGYFYKHQATYSPRHWEKVVGIPDENVLMAPPHKAWAFGFAVSPDPMGILWNTDSIADIVQYTRDTSMRKVRFGLVGTLYTLDPNGQTIRYWDTGLPPVFNKFVTTPQNGKFVAENLAASASTLLVIDKQGRMFTRMWDYEKNGGVPIAKYTYNKEDLPEEYNFEDQNDLAIVNQLLPVPDWRPQPQIPLSGSDFITTEISMHMTGEGDHNRQIRVVGQKDGKTGYFFKKIYDFNPEVALDDPNALIDAPWEFEATSLISIDESKIIRPTQSEEENDSPAADYYGEIKKLFSTSDDMNIRLLDYYYASDKATLAFDAEGETFEMEMHFADLWRPDAQAFGEDFKVGMEGGSPKLMFGTLIIPDHILVHPNVKVQEIINRYFRPFHLEQFAYSVEATDKKVIITSHPTQRMSNRYLDIRLMPLTQMYLRVDPKQQMKNIYSYSDNINLRRLKLANVSGHTSQRVLREFIHRNQKALKDMKKTWRSEIFERTKTLVSNFLFSQVWLNVDIFASVTGITHLIKEGQGIPYRGGWSTYTTDMSNARELFFNENYKSAKETLENRIESYERYIR